MCTPQDSVLGLETWKSYLNNSQFNDTDADADRSLTARWSVHSTAGTAIGKQQPVAANLSTTCPGSRLTLEKRDRNKNSTF